MPQKLKPFLLAMVVVMSAHTARPQSKATSTRLDGPPDAIGGKLYITVGGQERKIYDDAFIAWLVNDGRDVVFSGRDGAGGFENEGQSLRIFNVETGTTKKILAEYVMVIALKEVKTSNGATALLVKLADGGLGGSYFAVVDPQRGEVFYRQWAELRSLRGDQITLGFYRQDDWETMEQGDDAYSDPNRVLSRIKEKPYKIETHDLKQVLKNQVIFNKPDYEDSEKVKSRNVMIYLWDFNDNNNTDGISLKPATRSVSGLAVLRRSLEMLFAGPTDEEKSLSSVTFGMKFEDVKLQKGVALVKFSQPPNETNYGSRGPAIFSEAIAKTAKQFPTVKRVQICAIGETLFDAQLEKPFPKCK